MESERIRKPIPVSGLPSMCQLGILVLDGSGSMGEADGEGRGTKAAAVGAAVKGLIERLRQSTRREDFFLSIIVFDNRVEPPRLMPTPVADIDLETLDVVPMLGGQTAIGDALAKAGEVAADFLAQGGELPRKAVIMVMTDGQNNYGQNPVEAAGAVKQRLGDQGRICCVAYGRDADKALMRSLCSEPAEKNFTETDSAPALRNFFEASMMAE